LTDLEGISAATQMSVLDIPLSLLFLSRSTTLFLGPEDVRHCP